MANSESFAAPTPSQPPDKIRRGILARSFVSLTVSRLCAPPSNVEKMGRDRSPHTSTDTPDRRVTTKTGIFQQQTALASLLFTSPTYQS